MIMEFVAKAENPRWGRTSGAELDVEEAKEEPHDAVEPDDEMAPDNAEPEDEAPEAVEPSPLV